MATCSGIHINESTTRRLRLLALLINGGTTVLRHVFDQSVPSNTSLETHLNSHDIRTRINELVKKKAIPRPKLDLLYPLVGKPDSSNFDVTILVALLRNICGLDPANSPVWDKYPASHDTSKAADITRIRCQRNKISHLSELTMTELEFENAWDEMEQVLLRLGSSLPDVQIQIHAMKTTSIDPENRKSYEDSIAEWIKSDKLLRDHLHEMDETLEQTTKAVDNLEGKTEAIDKKVEALQIESSELKHLKATTMIHFDDLVKDDFYVKTQSYQAAKEKLTQNGCLVLGGHPGEGKSTMAMKLIQDGLDPERCLKLREPSDWKVVDLSHYDIIFIDDVFGACTKSDNLVNTWETHLADMWKMVRKKRIYVIITSRSYILEEARTDLSHIAFLSKELTVTLSSKDMTLEEKLDILQKGLDQQSKQISEEQTQEVIDLLTDLDLESYCVERQGSFIFGFPECVHMFVTNEELFRMGPEFFRAPLEFFVKSVKSLKRDEKRFLALAIIWFKNDQRINKSDLDMSNISHEANELVKRLGFKIKGKLIKTLRVSLESHVGGLLKYKEQDGSYAFNHATIGETIGLVVGQEHTELTIEQADIDFLMGYLTTDSNHRDDYHIFVEEHLLEKLTLRFLKEMFTSESLPLDALLLKRGGHCGNKLRPYYSFDASICSHDAFENEIFVKMFLKHVNENQKQWEILCSNPVVDMTGFFMSHGILLETVSIYLPSYSLIYNSGVLLREMWRSKLFPENYEEDISIGLLLACHFEKEHAVSFLLEIGARNIDDALYIAATRENTKIIEMLTKKTAEKGKTKSHIVNGNSPLIIAAKRGLLKSVNSLIDNGVDLMFQNDDGETAFDKAVKYNQTQVCQVLIDHGVPFKKKTGKFKRTPLHIAADLGHVDVVACLLKNGASTKIKDHRSHYPIHCAAIRCQVSTVRLLLDHDLESANVRITSYGKRSFIKGMSLFHIAVWKDSVDLIGALLEKEIDANIRDNYGRTPLYCAAYDGKPEIVKLLLPVADVDLPDKHGYTPLHASIHRCHTKVSELLIPHANINSRDRHGRTPYHVACEVGNLKIVKDMILCPELRLDRRMCTKRYFSDIGIAIKKLNERIFLAAFDKALHGEIDTVASWRNIFDYLIQINNKDINT